MLEHGLESKLIRNKKSFQKNLYKRRNKNQNIKVKAKKYFTKWEKNKNKVV